MAKESGKSNKAALRLKKRLATAKKALKFYSDQKQLQPEDDKTEDQKTEPIENGETAEE